MTAAGGLAPVAGIKRMSHNHFSDVPFLVPFPATLAAMTLSPKPTAAAIAATVQGFLDAHDAGAAAAARRSG